MLWSLAVEEQFYIFWPFVVLLCPERALAWVAAALVVAAPLLRAIATPWFDSFWPIYYLTPFRMDLLAAGALLAVLLRRDRRALEPYTGLAVAGACIALALLAWLHLSNPRFRAANTPLSNAALYSISLLLCTSIVVIALRGRGLVQRVLTHPVLVYVGTISYTVYLVPGPPQRALCALALAPEPLPDGRARARDHARLRQLHLVRVRTAAHARVPRGR